MRKYLTPAVLAAALFGAEAVDAAPLLDSTDFIIPIDTDPPVVPVSNYPLGTNIEPPIDAFDGIAETKYLNFGERNSGVIVTPVASSIIKSLVLTTANDAVERDPTSFKLWGTNDPITTPDNTTGPSLENWTLISEGPVTVPDTRLTAGTPVDFGSHTTSYSSYRITFPTVKNFSTANSMQIGDIGLFDAVGGTGNNVALFPIDARAILLDPIPTFQSSSPVNEPVVNILDPNGPRLDLPAQSGYSATEGVANLIDGLPAKYLNTGGSGSGFIVTPAGGASTVRSFTLTTANDAPLRDPVSYELYGTNSAIASTDNSYGNAESWTLLGSGALALPATRDTLGPVVPVSNEASFTSYKMVFPAVGGGNLLQLAEASFYSTPDGMGADILNPGDPILAIGTRNGIETKYLNFGEQNSGFIVTPGGSTVATSFQITTANDAPERDPASYEIYGSNDSVTSEAHSQGSAENWTLIASGALTLPDARFTEGAPVSFANTTAYTSYKVVFPTVKDGDDPAPNANSMQIAGFQLFDSSAPSDADFDNDGDVDGSDFLTWQRNVGAAGNNSQGDADGNGQINGLDLAAWRAEFGPAAAAAVGAVPEPSSVILVGVMVGAATLAGRGFGKRR